VSDEERTGIWQFDGRKVAREMQEICAWLKANRIVPADVPVDARVRITKGGFGQHCLTVDVLLKRNGRPYLDAATGEPARSTMTVPLTEPLPKFRSLIKVAPDGR
jgi:hypothetical protein